MIPIFVAERRCQGRISSLELGLAGYIPTFAKAITARKNKFGKTLWIKARECLKHRLLKKCFHIL